MVIVYGIKEQQQTVKHKCPFLIDQYSFENVLL